MVDVYFQKMTADGYQQIKHELENLKKERPVKIKQLQKARALGDLSENAEYSAAKRDLRYLESRLRYLNKQLQYSQIITPIDNNRVEIGTEVSLIFEDDTVEDTYKIVGKHEVNVDENKISFASPIGKAVMHKKVNETVTVTAPSGNYQVTITKISLIK